MTEATYTKTITVGEITDDITIIVRSSGYVTLEFRADKRQVCEPYKSEGPAQLAANLALHEAKILEKMARESQLFESLKAVAESAHYKRALP